MKIKNKIEKSKNIQFFSQKWKTKKNKNTYTAKRENKNRLVGLNLKNSKRIKKFNKS